VPHKSSSMVRTIAMQMLDPITPPSKVNPSLNVPPDVEAVLMRALVKNRDERYQTMSDMLVALDGITLDSHTIPDTGPPSMVAPERTSGSLAEPGPRRNKPPTRPLHEPQFVDTPGKPVSFSHVYDDAPLDMERRSRWPMIIAGLLMLLVGAGGTILLIMKLQGGKGDKDKVVTGPERIDAAIVAELADAGVQVPDALAVVDVPPDAGTRVTTKAGRDAGVGGVSGRPTGKGNVTVEVMTRPGEANVFIGNNYRGPSGVKITERFGAKVKIVCKTDRMKGSIDVTFNGELTAVMCNATRDRFCVPGLKNPYDDCEEDPNASP